MNDRDVGETFELGTVVATPAALAVLHRLFIDPWHLLNRHKQGDWGDLSEEDRQSNEDARLSGARIFSSYEVSADPASESNREPLRIWVITEARDDSGRRRSTCILTPECY